MRVRFPPTPPPHRPRSSGRQSAAVTWRRPPARPRPRAPPTSTRGRSPTGRRWPGRPHVGVRLPPAPRPRRHSSTVEHVPGTGGVRVRLPVADPRRARVAQQTGRPAPNREAAGATPAAGVSCPRRPTDRTPGYEPGGWRFESSRGRSPFLPPWPDRNGHAPPTREGGGSSPPGGFSSARVDPAIPWASYTHVGGSTPPPAPNTVDRAGCARLPHKQPVVEVRVLRPRPDVPGVPPGGGDGLTCRDSMVRSHGRVPHPAVAQPLVEAADPESAR